VSAILESLSREWPSARFETFDHKTAITVCCHIASKTGISAFSFGDLGEGDERLFVARLRASMARAYQKAV
jgi:hypothetical protein